MGRPKWSRLSAADPAEPLRTPSGAGLCRASLRPTEDRPPAPGLHPACHLCLLQPPNRKGSESTDRALPCGHGSAVASCVSRTPGGRGGRRTGRRVTAHPRLRSSSCFPCCVTISVLIPLNDG